MTLRTIAEVDVSEDVCVYSVAASGPFGRILHEARCDRCKWLVVYDDLDSARRDGEDHECPDDDR